jgi:hypothetical protein
VAYAPPVLGIVVNTGQVRAFGDAVLDNNASWLQIRIGLPTYLPLVLR